MENFNFICHIIGLNAITKQKLEDLNPNFNIIDLDIINKDKIGGDNQYDKFITIWNNIKLIYSRLNLDLFDIITTEQFVLNKIQYIKDKILLITPKYPE